MLVIFPNLSVESLMNTNYWLTTKVSAILFINKL